MEDQVKTTPEEKIVEFIAEHLGKWRDHMRANYYEDWARYERMWLGLYAEADRERASERSRLISPDTQQAIEAYEAEMVEAVFGGDKWFDIDNDVQDEDPEGKIKIEMVRITLDEDFKVDKVSQAVKECITYAGIYGKGIGEIILSDTKIMKPHSRKIEGTNLMEGGVATMDRFSVKLKSVHPRNFVIDPTSTTVQDGMGCAVEEMVAAHQVIRQQQKGNYRDVPIYTGDPTNRDAAGENIGISTMPYRDNQVKLTKYYGLVPRKWLKEVKDSGTTPISQETLEKAVGVDTPHNPFEDYADMVEAIVVIANDVTLLKCEENPYMMKDRPIVAYDCDPIPGKFWGRGIAQKGMMMQSAIDAQLRMHMDSTALTAAPMMAMDGTRLPRGFRFEIHPGRSVKVNGNPSEIFNPFKFGETSPISVETMSLLQQKFLQATGTLDAAGMAADGAGGASPGVSLAMSGIIKKNRRSLMNFTNDFLMPFIEKAAWRYMQFDSKRYPVADYRFVPMSTLGMIAREYEQQHLMAVMSTLGPDSPLVPMLMIKYIENSGLTNKQEFIKELKELLKPDPEAAQRSKEQAMLTNEGLKGQMFKLKSEIAVNDAKAADIKETTRLRQYEIQAQMMGSLSRNTEDDPEFKKRVEVAKLTLQELDIRHKEADSMRNQEIVREQMQTQKEIANTKTKSTVGD